ncbi:MAG: RsmG family class I SAM-dependent methyltransferase [Ilumatobacteraceae bacterium]
MTDDTRLLAALAVIQVRGGIGERSLSDAVAHADRFVELIPEGTCSLIDLGSGGGLPALVIAWRRPDAMVTMVERRATRADLLRRAVISLDLGERTRVLNQDVSEVCSTSSHAFDVVTARSFGEVAITTRFVDGLLAPNGVGLISEPPVDRSQLWASVLGQYSNLTDSGTYQGIRRLDRRKDPSRFT